MWKAPTGLLQNRTCFQLLPIVMANLQRTAKSANDWTPNDLRAYNVTVESLDFLSFFGHHAPNLPATDFLTHENPVQMTNDNDIELMHYAYLATHRVLNEESTVSDFTRDLLKAMGYTKRDSGTLRTHREIPMYICMERRSATTDVCLLNAENEITLVVQEHKWHIDDTNEPEPQLIAEAIAAFAYNNFIREVVVGRPIHNQQIIYGIIMNATAPAFYKIPVSKQLADAVRRGEYPDSPTKVTTHIPQGPRPSRRSNEGMLKLDNRRIFIACFEALKALVLW